MKILNIKRFATGVGDEEDFSVNISYQYLQSEGLCTGVIVSVYANRTFSGVEDSNGNDVSSEWSEGYPTGELHKTYYENTTETLTFISRYGEEDVQTITIDDIDIIFPGEDNLENPSSNGGSKMIINSDIKVNNLTLSQIDTKVNNIYPINSLFRTTNSETDPNELYDGVWTLISSNVIDTGWQNYSYTNSSFIGTTQSSYTFNKWRIVDNVLHVAIGAGATAAINTGTETEIARIPIANVGLDNSQNRFWNGAVGAGGVPGGFYLQETANGVGVSIKPHTSSNLTAVAWYSTHFTYPLPSTFTFKSGSYKREYVWERVS